MDPTAQSQNFASVCAVVDAQGFHSEGKFYPREIAFISKFVALNFEFSTGLTVNGLSEKDKRSNAIIMRLIGLTLDKEDRKKGDPMTYENLDEFLTTMHAYLSTREAQCFAIKNNALEKVFNRLSIPYINLDEEKYQCPTVADLYARDRKRMDDCGSHGSDFLGYDGYFRCSWKKSRLLYQWMVRRMKAKSYLELANQKKFRFDRLPVVLNTPL